MIAAYGLGGSRIESVHSSHDRLGGTGVEEGAGGKG